MGIQRFKNYKTLSGRDEPQNPVHQLPIGETIKLGKRSIKLICPACYECIETRVKRKFSTYQHSMALLFCTTGLIWIAWLPYCKRSWKNCVHYCTKCGKHVGTHQSDP